MTSKTVELIEFASDAAFAVDRELRIIGWNSGAEELLGYTAAETIGRPCGRILRATFPTGEPVCSSSCEGRACFAIGRKFSVAACRLLHKNGQTILAGISTLVMPPGDRNDDRDATAALIFLRNIQDREIGQFPEMPMRIFTLGQFGLSGAGKGLNVEGWKRKQAVVVLKCLVNQLNRPVHRERLIEWLWPNVEPERGWQRLKVTVSFLRSKLHAGGGKAGAIETIGQSYMLRRDGIWLDSEAFDSLVTTGWEHLKKGNRLEAIARFEEAEGLYRGDYFEDEPYAEWCAGERERLREMYLELLAGLTTCYAKSGQFMEAARVCRVALAVDLCRESFMRELLENLVNLGRPDWAERQFIAWRNRLVEEIGFQPMPETISTYQRLMEHRTSDRKPALRRVSHTKDPGADSGMNEGRRSTKFL